MLASFSSILTALAMLVHSVVGCCWHHPHTQLCHASGEAALSADAAHTEHLCEHSHDDDHGSSTDDSPSDSDEHDHHGACGEGKCQYLNASSPDMGLLCSLWAAVEMAGAESSAACSLVGPHAQIVDVRALPAPSVRAVTQVWLL